MLRILYWITILIICMLSSYLLYQIIDMIRKTFRVYRLIKRLEQVVELSKVVVLSGIEQNLKDNEKLTLSSFGGKAVSFTVSKENNSTKVDGLKIDFQKDILEQLEPIFTGITGLISSYIDPRIVKNILMKKCMKVEGDVKRLQELINMNEMEGAKV